MLILLEGRNLSWPKNPSLETAQFLDWIQYFFPMWCFHSAKWKYYLEHMISGNVLQVVLNVQYYENYQVFFIFRTARLSNFIFITIKIARLVNVFFLTVDAQRTVFVFKVTGINFGTESSKNVYIYKVDEYAYLNIKKMNKNNELCWKLLIWKNYKILNKKKFGNKMLKIITCHCSWRSDFKKKLIKK